MNNDPRLLEWLRTAEHALGVPASQRAAALEALAQRRAELQRSLEEAPVARCSVELAQKLRAAEAALAQSVEELDRQARNQMGELRAHRHAAQGYRPSEEDIPLFVSRSA